MEASWIGELFPAQDTTGSDERSAGATATRFHRDDKGRLWTGGNVVFEALSEWEGDIDGAQAVESERLNSDVANGRSWKPVIVSRVT